MTWRSRSEENLKAARLCQEGGVLAPAVTRYYYAAYHSALDVVERLGLDPPEERDGEGYWSHVAVARMIGDLFQDSPNLEVRYELLRSRRVRADYRLDIIKASQCETVRSTAEELIAELWRRAENADLS